MERQCFFLTGVGRWFGLGGRVKNLGGDRPPRPLLPMPMFLMRIEISGVGRCLILGGGGGGGGERGEKGASYET